MPLSFHFTLFRMLGRRYALCVTVNLAIVELIVPTSDISHWDSPDRFSTRKTQRTQFSFRSPSKSYRTTASL